MLACNMNFRCTCIVCFGCAVCELVKSQTNYLLYFVLIYLYYDLTTTIIITIMVNGHGLHTTRFPFPSQNPSIIIRKQCVYA